MLLADANGPVVEEVGPTGPTGFGISPTDLGPTYPIVTDGTSVVPPVIPTGFSWSWVIWGLVIVVVVYGLYKLIKR